MCLAPQWDLFFWHLNNQTCSEPVYILHFRLGLGNVLRATTASFFRHLNFQKVVWECCVLYILTLTWKCVSCHSGVHFFMSHLTCWLRPRRFSEHTFRPSWATNLKTQCFETCLPSHAPGSSFFWLCLLWSSFAFFYSLTVIISAIHASVLSQVWLLDSLQQRRGANCDF